MSVRPRNLLAVGGVLVIGLGLLLWRPWQASDSTDGPRTQPDESLVRPMRPTRPPVPGQDRPASPPSPKEPPGMERVRAQTYAKAKREGHEQPGDAAFRATVDAFIAYNHKFAEAQAHVEGITVDEVRELTYFGFLVMDTQRWPEVEDIIGRQITDEEKQLGEALMHRANSEFKSSMRTLVAEGADISKRWQLIRDTQRRYKREYFALTGMDAGQLDDLLAGDITRTGAPIANPPPADVPVNPETPEPTPPRPTETPRQP